MIRHLLPIVTALVLLAGVVAAQIHVRLPAVPGHSVATTGYGIDEYAHAGYAWTVNK
jgi:hypothetical protein